MNKYVKILSLTLAVLLIAMSVPFTIFAKTLQTTYQTNNLNNLGNETYPLLLELDNIASDITDEGITVFSSEAVVQDMDATDSYIKYSNENTDGGWGGYIGRTNLSLTDESCYTVTFKSKWDATNLQVAGFTFAAPGATETESSANKTKQSILLDVRENHKKAHTALGMGWGSYVGDITETFSGWDLSTEYTYTVSINKNEVYLLIDDTLIGCFPIDTETYYPEDLKLALGITCRYSSFTKDTGVSMSDIKVYQGAAFTSETVDSYKDGDLLFSMSSPFDLNTFESEFTDLTVSAITPQNVTTTTVDNVGKIKFAGTAASSTHAGINTNLPIGVGHKYTIELDIKSLVDNNHISICHDYTSNKWAQGINFDDNAICWMSEYKQNDPKTQFSNPWITDGRDTFTHIVITVDGMTATAYVDGDRAGSVTFSEIYSSNQTLSVTIKTHTNADYNEKDIIAVKDLKVTSGIVAQKTVNFVKDGESVESEYSATVAGGVIPTFPEIDVATDEVAVWFYEGTNVVVTAPYKVLKNVNLEAKVFKKSSSEIVGIQYTDESDAHTHSVRFISVIHSLEGSEVGFEVTAKFLDNGNLREYTWDPIRSNFVYSSINATVNGTVKSITANELGGTYIVALAVDDVPTNIGQIDFYVKSYVKINSQKVYSEQKTVTLVNGAVSDNALLS